MRKSIILLAAILITGQLHAQHFWAGTPATVQTNLGDGYATYTEFAFNGWGGHHAMLFNAHPRTVLNDGNFFDNSNVQYHYSAGAYSSGAGAIMFMGNGGRMDFLVSGVSTGAGNPVSWSPAISISRGNVVGLSNNDPKFALHVRGTNGLSNQMTLGSTTTGNFAITDPNGGAYGLFAGVSGTGNTWLQGGRYDSNTAYDISLQGVGGNVLIGGASCTGCTYRLNVFGRARMNEVVVNTTGADFVFDDSYRLRPLSEVEKFINENKHLPEIEPAREFEANGMEVGKMETKLLQKVEELTLYLIELQKEVEQLKAENKAIRTSRH